MGLCVALRAESGEQFDFVADEKNLLNKLLRNPNPTAFPTLASIHRFGDTVFNRIQMDRLLAEWKPHSNVANTSEEDAVLRHVVEMGEKAAHGVHLYLVFIGD